MKRTPLFILTVSCCLAFTTSCASTAGSGGGGGGDASINKDVVYDPPKNLSTWVYTNTPGDGTSQTVTVRVAGVKSIGGKDYARVQVGKLPQFDGDPAANYTEAWAQPDGTGVIFAGGELHNGALGLPVGTPTVTLKVEPPVRLETNIAVGVPEYVTATGTILLGDPATATPITGTQTAKIVLVSKDTTVETGVGTVTGASHYTGEVVVNGEKAEGAAWLVSGTGVVAASGTWNGIPGSIKSFKLGLAGTGGVTVQGDHHIAEHEAILTKDNPKFSIDTYDLDGGFFADKSTHANMLLEVRWADPETAKTTAPPPVTIDFGTSMGYYPANLTDVPISVLHPEENGKGYHFWSALVNQGAKNEPGTTTSFHIKATHNGSGAAVRATGQLNYRYLKQ